MLVVVATEHPATLLLRADLTASDPFVFDDFVKGGTFLWVYLQHPADDMSALSGEQAQ